MTTQQPLPESDPLFLAELFCSIGGGNERVVGDFGKCRTWMGSIDSAEMMAGDTLGRFFCRPPPPNIVDKTSNLF